MKSICVYCGSSPGRNPAYAKAAKNLGRELALRGIRLIYGGASVGIMGTVADAVLQHGGQAVGVIPESLKRKEVAHLHLTELHVTSSMHERKMMMADLSDGFIALPGGIGTLEEISEIWTWAQLGLHRKPFGLPNVEGYYDPLIAFLDHTVAEGFVKQQHRSMLVVDENPVDLLDRLARYVAPDVEKWIGRSET